MTMTAEPIMSLSNPSESDRTALDAQLMRERQWYADTPRFQTDEDIATAIQNGQLVEVTSTDDYRRISRFENDVEGFMPYLTPRARHMLDDFAARWRVILWTEHNQAPLELLSVTSMVRPQTYQNKIVANPGKLASPDSTHCVGNAVDIDVSGYYRLDSEGQIWTHTHPGRAVGQLAIGAQLETRFGVMPDAPKRAGWYDPRITEAAVQAAEEMYASGSINLVKEFEGTPNACLHLAASPEYPL